MEETLIYTQHYANSITEVYLTEDKKTVIQKKCLYSSCGEYKYDIDEYLDKKMVGYRQIRKQVSKTNYIIDIDGTICTEHFDKKGNKDYTKATPLKARIKHLNQLYDKGNEIHYWTARGSVTGINHKKLTEDQLKKWGCKYNSLRVGDKPNYDIWIDDKAKWSEDYFKNII